MNVVQERQVPALPPYLQPEAIPMLPQRARFGNQVAIVTGGASGIGKATALQLAREGADVTIVDHPKAQGAIDAMIADAASQGLSISGVALDITQSRDVEHVFHDIYSKKNHLDVVVNSAGITGKTGVNTAEVDLGNYREVIEVNLFGSFNVLQKSLPLMNRMNYGRIVLIASVAGLEGNPGMVPYSTSKGAVIALGKATGLEQAQQNSGVTVNVVCPVTVLTPMVAAMPQASVDFMKSKIPAGRFLTLEEVIRPILYFASTDAGADYGKVDHISLGRIRGS